MEELKTDTVTMRDARYNLVIHLVCTGVVTVMLYLFICSPRHCNYKIGG